MKMPSPSQVTKSKSVLSTESGATLVVVLVLLTLITLLAMSLIFTTEVELEATANYRDRVTALSDTDNALNELLWRFNLEDGSDPPPVGSTIDVNAMKDFNAAIDYDPQGILTNGSDDDGDGTIDEPDELNLAHDWGLRLMRRMNDDVPLGLAKDVYLVDADIKNGPPWGSKLVVPTVQPYGTWRDYTTNDPGSDDALQIRFKLDTDTVLGDSEGDGPEIVFYDPTLHTNTDDEANTLSDLGGDGDPATGSPYNITWSDGVTTYPAVGAPVMLVTATATVDRGGREVARRKIEAELVRSQSVVYPKAVCTCGDLALGGSVDSYKSSEGAYGTGPIYDNGNIGANGNIDLTGGGIVSGYSEAGGITKLSGTINKDAWSGGAIVTTADVVGTSYPNFLPVPQPCECDLYDLPRMMDEKRANNDNANILPNGTNPYEYGKGCSVSKFSIWKKPLQLEVGSKETVIFPGGDYFLEHLIVSGELQVGVDSDGDCIVDGPPTRPVRIFVEGDVDLRGRGIVNGSQLPMDLEIIVNSESKPFTAAGKFTFRGTVYHPGDDCNVSGGAVIEGSVVCGGFNGGGDGVHYDEDLFSHSLVDMGVSVIAWRVLD